mmetsp:Transcript_60402/g.120950  ORF Transcript_60402/g.120950 Transcript_60402/m.120950 type:complete len:240 (-) Transcript_60402:480-1199(-)
MLWSAPGSAAKLGGLSRARRTLSRTIGMGVCVQELDRWGGCQSCCWGLHKSCSSHSIRTTVESLLPAKDCRHRLPRGVELLGPGGVLRQETPKPGVVVAAVRRVPVVARVLVLEDPVAEALEAGALRPTEGARVAVEPVQPLDDVILGMAEEAQHAPGGLGVVGAQVAHREVEHVGMARPALQVGEHVLQHGAIHDGLEQDPPVFVQVTQQVVVRAPAAARLEYCSVCIFITTPTMGPP